MGKQCKAGQSGRLQAQELHVSLKMWGINIPPVNLVSSSQASATLTIACTVNYEAAHKLCQVTPQQIAAAFLPVLYIVIPTCT